MVKKLEKCARCGGKPMLIDDQPHFFVRCHAARNPHIYCWEGPACATRKEARKVWNRGMRAMRKATRKGKK